MNQMRTFDEVFKDTKQYGIYQVIVFVLFQWNGFAQAASAVAGFYMLGGLKPDYVCNDVDFNSTDTCYTIQHCRNLTIHSVYRSIYEEFNWACVNSHLIYTMASLMHVATVIGLLASGHLADWLGRKWLVYIGLIYSIAANLFKSWIPAWQYYFFILLISSLVSPLTYHPAFALAMETVGKRYRVLQSYAFQFTLAYMINAVVGYVVADWRMHLRVMFFANLPVLIIWLFIAESPRWLIQKKKYKAAADALNKIAWCNGAGSKMFTENEMRNVDIGGEKHHIKYNIFHMFYTRKLALYSLTQFATGICINLVSTVILMNVQDLAGSPFLNVFCFGLLRIWSPPVIILLDKFAKCFGRRQLFMFSQGTITVCFFSICLLQVFSLWSRFHYAGTALALLGYTMNFSVVWVAYKQYTTELYPTVIRSIALSSSSLVSLVGSILAPQFIYLKLYWDPTPYATCAVWSAITLLLGTLVLPETRGRSLPDTLEDVLDIEHREISAKMQHHARGDSQRRQCEDVELLDGTQK